MSHESQSVFVVVIVMTHSPWDFCNLSFKQSKPLNPQIFTAHSSFKFFYGSFFLFEFIFQLSLFTMQKFQV
jgi:hypothetical protein